MNTFYKVGMLLFGTLFAGSVALADTPPSLKVPDTHSIMSKGNLTLYRVQVEGLEFGRNNEEIDAEVFVTLDSKPDMVFTLRLHGDSPPVNTVIANTLREAYLSKTPVTIYHQIAPGRKNVKIHMVQFDR
ncbi:MAG: hypothetical protein FD165_487 [Gammaproteobacteria bacterium]|nr:MAG: hypothetical protein FD165_487 [Gammaproteobacteria bacterium]TND02251.1 MAG: hypothetical protein FD120_2415 [Gammaproteobacteria bacterium]